MPGGPSMTSTPPCPRNSAVTDAAITFNSPARPRIGGVTSWPPTSKRPVEGPMGCPVYRLLDCHCRAAIVGTRPSTRNTYRCCSALHAIGEAPRRRPSPQRSQRGSWAGGGSRGASRLAYLQGRDRRQGTPQSQYPRRASGLTSTTAVDEAAVCSWVSTLVLVL